MNINDKIMINQHYELEMSLFFSRFSSFFNPQEFPGMPRRNRSATTLGNAVRSRNWPCPAKPCSSPSKAKLARTKLWNMMEINMARALCRPKSQNLKKITTIQNGSEWFRMVQNGSDALRSMTSMTCILYILYDASSSSHFCIILQYPA